MQEKKVAILLSSYNGEKYIAEQLESLFNQTYKNIDIIVRDDGSKDNTKLIIKNYIEKGKNIKLIEGENKGYTKSFFELLKLVNEADYYAFCDQDDVWESDKIERSVESLLKLPEDKPNLFFSKFDYYDMEMNFVEHGEEGRIYNFRNSIVECIPHGMSMCINKKARNMIVDNIPQNCVSHDSWTYMLCTGLGNIVYDDKALIRYRRHTSSVTVEGMNFIQFQIWRVKKCFFGDMIKDVKKQIIEFGNLYNNNLKEDDKKVIKLFMNEKYNFVNAVKKVFYPKRFRKKLTDEIFIRMIFMIGIL